MLEEQELHKADKQDIIKYELEDPEQVTAPVKVMHERISEQASAPVEVISQSYLRALMKVYLTVYQLNCTSHMR